jgi:hypothetical protein
LLQTVRFITALINYCCSICSFWQKQGNESAKDSLRTKDLVSQVRFFPVKQPLQRCGWSVGRSRHNQQICKWYCAPVVTKQQDLVSFLKGILLSRVKLLAGLTQVLWVRTARLVTLRECYQNDQTKENDGRGMWHIRETKEMHTRFWGVNLSISGRPRRRSEGADWIHLAQDRVPWNVKNSLTRWGTAQKTKLR